MSDYNESSIEYNEDLYTKQFIERLRGDLDSLKEEEKFQRHIPEYYAEGCYYNYFHRNIPNELFLTPCYEAFLHSYIDKGKNLYESVSAFLEEYDKGEY